MKREKEVKRTGGEREPDKEGNLHREIVGSKEGVRWKKEDLRQRK